MTFLGHFYVYVYEYPDGSIFYVGKGKADRMNDHVRMARKGGHSRQCEIIRFLLERDGKVTRKKIAHFFLERDALMYEWAMINMSSFAENLVNVTGGTVRNYEPQVVGNTVSWILSSTGESVLVAVYPTHFVAMGGWSGGTIKDIEDLSEEGKQRYASEGIIARLGAYGLTRQRKDILLAIQNEQKRRNYMPRK